MARILHPQKVIFSRDFLHVRRQCVKELPKMSRARRIHGKGLERPGLTLLSRFLDQKIEFAGPDVLANLLVPLILQKFLIPLVELG